MDTTHEQHSGPRNPNPWWKKRCLIRLTFLTILLIFLANEPYKASANGYDGSLMNGFQVLPQWQEFMHTPEGTWLGFVNAVYSLGILSAYPFSPFISQNYGRKCGSYIGYLCLLAGTILQTCAKSPASFIVARYITGISCGFWTTTVPLLIAEITYPPHRGWISLLFMCGYYVGGVLAAVRDGLFMFLVVAQSYAGGDLNAPIVTETCEMIETALALERSTSTQTFASEMIRTKGNRHRLLISFSLAIFTQWCGSGVVSYYLTLILDTVGVTSIENQLIISGCLQIWNLILALAASLSVDRLGRRRLFQLSAAIMLVSFTTITGLSASFAESGTKSVGLAAVPFLFVFFGGYDIALTPLLTSYPCEIWPFSLRAQGLTFTWLVAIVASCFNVFVTPIAMEAIGWKYYTVFVVMTLIYNVTVALLYPETRGYTLEEIAQIFDDNVDGVVSNEKRSSLLTERVNS
ncbi:hypothetical protein N7456_003086 [Penicillium angulare]|uniref:Major facilitator superfamily (MFS) profile domain-containing protein n=1 Tax=Penicillium angulare TaxID=116970 RepID=A0A9W9KHV8_9EURO|nr:hypothetical protein N7456_003086 [Penicillium angulare]